MTTTEYVCARCGVGVHQWGATRGWKHAAGGPVQGCGKPPIAVLREVFEAELADEIDVLHRNGWGIDAAREEVLARWSGR